MPRVAAVVWLVWALVGPVLGAGVAGAAGPCDAPANPVVAENCQPGNPPSDWDISFAGDPTIQGFATDISVARGATARFKVKTDAAAWHLDVYRMGYYQGNGARKVGTVANAATLKGAQPACQTDASVGLIDCGDWAESAHWDVPAAATSGIYFAKLVREDTGGASHVFFVVRDEASHADLLFQTSDTTWQAYNDYGDTCADPSQCGASLYTDHRFGLPASRAFKVSYNRPFNTRAGNAQKSFVRDNEYPAVRFLEANGYDVSYQSALDTDRLGAGILKQHKAFLSVGHDEYWSGGQRANVETARDAGVNLAFFSGNQVYWKTRWESAIDGSETPYRTLVSYKTSFDVNPASVGSVDPTAAWTGTWRDPAGAARDAGKPENALSGDIFTVEETDGGVKVPADYAKLRLWRNSPVAALPAGQIATLGVNVLGTEWDEDLDNGSRPPGTIDLSNATFAVAQRIRDGGTGRDADFGPGTATHSLTMYRAPSGALVFGAGSIQFAWGLDDAHDRAPSTPSSDPSLKQATANLLADMGAQPATLQPGLVPATASTDRTAPTSTVVGAPSAPQAGLPSTVTGSATDAGGGLVAGVEVSVDDGATWHKAAIARRATDPASVDWSYTWTPAGPGDLRVRSRAADDSLNLETPGPGTTVVVQPRPCPCSIWGGTEVPRATFTNAVKPIEVGVRFQTDAPGVATALRFYKDPANTGLHTVHLWRVDSTTAGTLLASAPVTVPFGQEGVAGWQQVALPAPVPLDAAHTYIASVVSTTGVYSADPGYFLNTGRANYPLRALQNSGVNGNTGTGNGVFNEGATSFPVSSFDATNYWVDVVFAPAAADAVPPAVLAQSPAPNATAVPPATSVTATFSEPIDPSSLSPSSFTLTKANGFPIAASVTYDATSHTATLTPNGALQSGANYAATITGVRDAAGNPMAAPAAWTFTTQAASTCTASAPCTIWTPDTTPSTGSFPDNSAIELGLRFQAAGSGTVTGARFYKGATNTGTHLAHLWSNTGTLLATATFTNESASGWQQATFDTNNPNLHVVGGTTYVISYYTPTGNYALDGAYFAAGPIVRGPLTALQDGPGSPQGSYKYGGGFPDASYNAANYWVDVTFAPDATGQSDDVSVAIGGVPAAAVEGQPVALSASSSGPVSFDSWSVTKNGNPFGSTGTGSSFTFTPDDQGTYVATLHYTGDTPGAVAATILVANAAPTATMAVGGPVPEPGTISVSLTGAADPSSADTAAGFHYAFSCAGGDLSGTTYATSSPASSTTCSFPDSGTYTVKGRVIDKDGGFAEYAATASVVNVAPTAAITGAPATSPEGTTLNLVGNATDPSGPDQAAGFAYAWTVTKDGAPYATGGSSLLALTPNDQGTYVVSLTATDKDGGVSAPASATISVANVAPTAAIAGAPGTGVIGTPISLTGSATDPSTADTTAGFTYAWNVTKNGAPFGSPGSGAAFGFTPDAAGTYVVSLTATDKDGATSAPATVTTQIAPPPTPAITGAPATSPEGTAISLGSSVTGPAPGDPVTYAWTVTKNGSPFGATGNGASYTFTPDDNGAYVVSLTTTTAGGTGSVTAAITATNVAPTAALAGSGPVNEGSPTTLSLTNPSDPSSSDTAAGFRYAFACDGLDSSLPTTYAAAGALTTASCTFADNGSYQVKGRVFDKDNGFSTYQAAVQVGNAPPASLTLNLNATSLPENGAVSLTGSFADPGTQDTHTVAIDWGDGSATTSLTLDPGVLSFGAPSHTYVDNKPANAPYSIGVVVTDKDGGSTSGAVTVTVTNVAPVPSIAGAPAAGAVGAPISLTGSATDPGTADTTAGFTYAWNVTKNGAPFGSPGSGAAFGFTPDAAGTYVVSLTATDKDGGKGSTTASVPVVVPVSVAIGGAPASVVEGTAVNLTASVTGASGSLSYAWSATKNGAPYASGTASSFSFTPNDNGAYAVTLTATAANGSASDSKNITATNAAPSPTIAGAPASSPEGTAISLTGSATDPGTADTTAGFTYGWSVTKNGSAFGAAGTGASYAFTPDDNGTYVVTLTAADKDGGKGTTTATVAVTNVAPTVGAITAPIGPVALGTAITGTATFTDPGTADTFTAVMDWGDGTTSPATLTGLKASASHTYAAAGVYTLKLTVTDDDAGAGQASYQYVVMYDPTAGSVTGGGWINSPAGAYTADPTVTGKAEFGFNSKYKKGASVPTGDTQFSFKSAKFKFDSTSYDWLVVSGNKAQYRGSGTINGLGDYAFTLTAIDGRLGGGVDKLRLKVWNKATGQVIYDNQLGASDSSDPTTALGGGNIQIHS